MKSTRRTIKNIVVGSLVASLALATVLAEKSPALDLAKQQLRAVAAPEMPAKAAQLCKDNATPENARNVVAAAVAVRPAATVAVVAAIARQTPALAPDAAAQAATLQPKEIAAIARAAASAAPSQAAKIVGAMCKAAPTRYNVVASVVAQEVPAAAKEILEAVTTAVPGVKPYVERASANEKEPSVARVMVQTDALVLAAASAAKTTPEQIITSSAPRPLAVAPPPSVGPPFTPLSAPPTELNRTNTAEIPPGGGRNYSGP